MIYSSVHLRSHTLQNLDSRSRSKLTSSERVRNRSEIAFLAQQLNRSFAEVSALYEDVYVELKSHARVFDFLPVLASRKVRARL